MIKIDQIKWLYCDSCHQHFGKLHELVFGTDISHQGCLVRLCDACLSELKEALEKKEVTR